ncbi:MAG TPA: zf-HC2 domain-containing protein [Gemmatimonadaceae bacterium]
MQHLDEGTIHAWLDGALDAEESSRVEEHTRECATCAAAVAEARGLVAGASRILTALDHVPAAVTPRAPASGGGSSSARSRSLWGTLHLTPLRAAAASLVFLAAGTLFVLRNAPNDEADFAKVRLVADTSRASTLHSAAPDSAPTVAGGLAQPAPASVPERRDAMRTKLIGGRPGARVSSQRDTEAVQAQVRASQSVAQAPARETKSAALADSTSIRPRDIASDVIATSSASREAESAKKAAAPVASSAVIGGTPQPAPMAARANFGAVRPAAPSLFVGCYAVTADSAAALPARLSLDSSLAVSLGRAIAGGSAGRAQRASAPTIDDAPRDVATIVGDTRQPLANAWWQPLANGGIRLSVDAPTRTLLLHPTPPADLIGSTTVGARVLPVILRRVECRRLG